MTLGLKTVLEALGQVLCVGSVPEKAGWGSETFALCLFYIPCWLVLAEYFSFPPAEGSGSLASVDLGGNPPRKGGHLRSVRSPKSEHLIFSVVTRGHLRRESHLKAEAEDLGPGRGTATHFLWDSTSTRNIYRTEKEACYTFLQLFASEIKMRCLVP